MVKTEEVPQLERIVREKSTAVDRLKTILKKVCQFCVLYSGNYFSVGTIFQHARDQIFVISCCA